jgi:hypothetical protein
MSEDNRDLTPDEQHANQIGMEDFIGYPAGGTAEDRLEIIKRRIPYLEGQIAATSEPLLLEHLRRDLPSAKAQLPDWKVQREGRN